MRRQIIAFIAATVVLAPVGVALAADDFVIIVNKDNGNAVTSEFAARAYRGEAKSWESGGGVTAVALPEEHGVRIAFDREILGKSPSQSKAMWAQMTFSGKATPPKMADTEADVVRIVSENKNAIGYVSPKSAGATVKVVK
jgi:ABC-type phosphate transport system substrate-binding protein